MCISVYQVTYFSTRFTVYVCALYRSWILGVPLTRRACPCVYVSVYAQ